MRGNQRTSGELSRKEGGKIFGSGSRAPIAISLLIKNPAAKEHGKIYFHDIGDYLTREEKLEKIESYASIAGITEASIWQTVVPDTHGDWLKQRDGSFSDFIVLGDKKSDALKLFDNFSRGLEAGRDAWCYNASKESVVGNMTRMVVFYNNEVARFNAVYARLDKKAREERMDGFINTDPAQISWTTSLKQELANDNHFTFKVSSLTPSLYRPFTKQWVYYDSVFIHRVGQMPRIFPDVHAENIVIWTQGTGSSQDFTCFISNLIPDLQGPAKIQCFPLYLYDPVVPAQAGTQSMLDWGEAKPLDSRLRGNDGDVRGDGGYVHGNDGYVRRDAITEEGLAHFQSAYPGETISKEDVFYYVYGLLHSPDYRERYADNLSKELPRIPHVKTAAGFRAFSQAGRKLAELHLNYETVPIYQGTKVLGADGKVFNLGDPKPLDSRLRGNDDGGRGNDEREGFWRVEKMKVPKTDGKKDLTRLIYNAYITVSGIPPEAYDYIVNGKPALDWVVERQCVKTDKDSGIVNDANDWAIETMGNPRYPLELFMRVVTVSLETMKIVNALPPLEIASD